MKENEPVSHLMLIAKGTAVVQRDGQTLTEIGEGQFLGEMAFFTGDHASATIVSAGPLSVVKWDMLEVKHLSLSRDHSEEAHAFSKLPSMFCR
jgi:CRP-like cAMP-binding protein